MGLRFDKAPDSCKRRRAFAVGQFPAATRYAHGGLLSARNLGIRFGWHNGCPQQEFRPRIKFTDAGITKVSRNLFEAKGAVNTLYR